MAADTGPDKINRYEIQGLIGQIKDLSRHVVYWPREHNTGNLNDPHDQATK